MSAHAICLSRNSATSQELPRSRLRRLPHEAKKAADVSAHCEALLLSRLEAEPDDYWEQVRARVAG